MNGKLDRSIFIEDKNKYPTFINLPLKEWKDENHIIKKLEKQDKLVI